jgi:hypothetical protein
MPGVEELPGLIARLEKVAIRLETATKAQTFSDPAGGLAASVTAFDEILEGALKVFLEASASLGQEVGQMAPQVEKAFRHVKKSFMQERKTFRPVKKDWHLVTMQLRRICLSGLWGFQVFLGK